MTTADPSLPVAAHQPGRSLRAGETIVMAILSATAIAATTLQWWPITMVEVLGFVTGGVCVWLVVREHVWNWPIGIANNIAFLVLFWRTSLFADAGLQIVYMVLGIYGWMLWIHGGAARTELTISRTPKLQWWIMAAAIPIATLVLRAVLIEVNGSAPLLDALTTVLSLTAQYMMCRKQLEHWLLWIAADLIYIPLYAARDLPLTAVLYGVFLVMCVIGWRDWQRTWRNAVAAQ